MKKIFLIIATITLSYASKAQSITIPDANLLSALIDAGVDTSNDGQIDTSEALIITTLSLNNKSISNMTGIEVFTNLTALECPYNQINNLDLSLLTKLTTLECSNNLLTNLDVTAQPDLSVLSASNNNLGMIDLSSSPNLTRVYLQSNDLQELDLRGLTQLNTLFCTSNANLTTICVHDVQTANSSNFNKDASANWSDTCPRYIHIPDANLLSALIDAGVDTSGDGKITISEALLINTLSLNNKSIADMTGIEEFINLTGLDCPYNQIDSLDISSLTQLTTLDCSNNLLTSLNVSSQPDLSVLSASNNSLTTIDVSSSLDLTRLYLQNNDLVELDLKGLTLLNTLFCTDNVNLTTICVDNIQTANSSNYNKDALAEWSVCTPLALANSDTDDHLEVLKAYNLSGQEVPVTTKGEVIILLYSNGHREKTVRLD